MFLFSCLEIRNEMAEVKISVWESVFRKCVQKGNRTESPLQSGLQPRSETEGQEHKTLGEKKLCIYRHKPFPVILFKSLLNSAPHIKQYLFIWQEECRVDTVTKSLL